MAQKIVHWLLITLVLSLGFGQLLRLEYFGVPIYFHDVLVIAILFLQGQALQVKKIDLRGLALMGAGLSVGWLYALTLYQISDLLVPLLYSLRLLAYLALYFVIKKSNIKIAPTYFLIGGIVQWFIGLIQYFFSPDMRVFQYLGWDDHLNRLTLPHFDPTFTAVMLGLFVLSSINYRSPYAVGCKLLAILAILLTYSRSVWLSLIFTGVISIKHKKIILVSSILLLASIFALPRKFGEGTNLLRTYSVTSRMQSDYSYITKYNWDLLIGRGMNTLILDSPTADLPNHANGPNNSYLYLLLTSGLLGLLGWGMFMYSLFKTSTHKPMLIFFFVASLFNNVMFYPFALLWTLLTESIILDS